MRAEPKPAAALTRILGLGFGVALAFGNTIGVGILRLPGPVAAALGDSTLIALVWILGGVYALLGAISVAELASMSMELISMEHWDVFFTNADDLKRAKKEHLQDALKTLLWIANVDKFQHWLYENPTHTKEERMKAWVNVYEQFGSKVIDWRGLQEAKENMWLKQLHIFEVPFYYIEYGMAQLGAIAVWRNYKRNPQKALDDYEAALRLGYTKSIPEIYKTAGIEFNFSQEYVRELATFVKEELAKL